MLQTRLSDFSEFRTKEEIQLTELGTIKVRENKARRAREHANGTWLRLNLRETKDLGTIPRRQSYIVTTTRQADRQKRL
jgi:hypothetical protein